MPEWVPIPKMFGTWHRVGHPGRVVQFSVCGGVVHRSFLPPVTLAFPSRGWDLGSLAGGPLVSLGGKMR